MPDSPDAARLPAPLIYFWEGGWFGVGSSRGYGVLPPHSHHTVQITIGLDGPVRFCQPGGDWVSYEAAAILPDAPHAFDGCGSLIAMGFVEPECREGRWLQHALRTPVSDVSSERLAPFLPTLRDLQKARPDTSSAARLITGVVRALCEGPPPVGALDDRVVRALEIIRGRDPRRLPLDHVAKEVFLSPGRLAHLFTAEVGLPFRRYILWRKLSLAMVEFARGRTLSAAAHSAGFADSAHLSRTWQQMFGLPPTAMVGTAEFYEIPPPFEIALRA
jgi:AraC family transcriptional regulator